MTQGQRAAAEHGSQRKEVRSELPTFTPKDAPLFNPETWRLRVDGTVGNPLSLSLEQVLNMEKVKIEADFECVAGWMVPRLVWEGVGMKTILKMANPLTGARFLMARAGGFSTCLPIEKALANNSILAYSLNGSSLSYERGAPLRLIFMGQNCFESIKWVHHLEVLEEYQGALGGR